MGRKKCMYGGAACARAEAQCSRVWFAFEKGVVAFRVGRGRGFGRGCT